MRYKHQLGILLDKDILFPLQGALVNGDDAVVGNELNPSVLPIHVLDDTHQAFRSALCYNDICVNQSCGIKSVLWRRHERRPTSGELLLQSRVHLRQISGAIGC